MLRHDTQNKIKNITAGTVLTGQQDTCTTIRNLLCTSFATSTTVKKDFEGKAIIKEKQIRFIEPYTTQHKLWIADFNYRNCRAAKSCYEKLNLNGAPPLLLP
jgi:hypothetical protein